MKTQIILLRGVMPTGKNKVPMAPLRTALEETGFHDVKTYIQSGNVILSSDLAQDTIEKRVHDVIADAFGGDIVVFSRTASYFKKMMARNPFASADKSRMYFTLLSSKPEKSLLKEFLAPGYGPDQVEVIDDMAYLLFATQYSNSRLNNNFIERKLKLAATTRVYNTIAKLVELTGQ